jgi:hypothetical protein
MADMDAFGKHWNLIAGENANHWVNSNSGLGNHDYDHFYEVNGNGNIYTVNSVDLSFGKKCMCHLQSSPFVPDVLTSETAGLQEQIDSLEMQLSQASQSISNLDSLLSSNVDGGGQGVDLNSLPQITSIECIEMGIGLSCSPQGGMCSNATLAPSNEGAYYLTHSCYTNFEPSFCTYPNWRKFVVHGTNLSDVSSIVKIHDNVQSNGYGGYVTSQSRDAATLLNQSDSSFVFYASRVDWEEIGLDNPISYWNSFPSDRMYRVALTIPAVGIIESPISIYFD